jgi:glycosyltransferase XagB
MHGNAWGRFADGRATPDPSVARLHAAEQAERLDAQPEAQTQYGFLIDAGVSAAALAFAEMEARRAGSPTHDVLFSAGFISPPAYAAALARSLDIAVTDWEAQLKVDPSVEIDEAEGIEVPARLGGRPCRLLCAEHGSPVTVSGRVTALKARGLTPVLCSRFRFDALMEEIQQSRRLYNAVQRLYHQQPSASAAKPVCYWQVAAAAIVFGLVVGGLSVAPDATLAAVCAVIALPFLCVTLLRIAALGEVIVRPRNAGRRHRREQSFGLGPWPLPVYSVLVPLFREANVLPGLVRSLQGLAYPKTRLEILLVLEAADLETQAAVAAMPLPGHFRTVLVPDHPPRTKPKALNYALEFARGEYIVVYDAEDRPEPDQLLRALELFRRGSPLLGCVQAQLNIYNPRSSWFSRGILAQTPQEVNPC